MVVTNTSDSDPRKIAKPDCLNETLLFGYSTLIRGGKDMIRPHVATRDADFSLLSSAVYRLAI